LVELQGARNLQRILLMRLPETVEPPRCAISQRMRPSSQTYRDTSPGKPLELDHVPFQILTLDALLASQMFPVLFPGKIGRQERILFLTFQCSLVGWPVTSPNSSSTRQVSSSTGPSPFLLSAVDDLLTPGATPSCILSIELETLRGGVNGEGCFVGRSVGRRTAGT
jgi:hypothetical protein